MTILNKQGEVIGPSSLETIEFRGYEFTVDESEPGTVTIAKADRVYVGDQLVYVREWGDPDLVTFKAYLYTYVKGKHLKTAMNSLRFVVEVAHDTPPRIVAEMVAAKLREQGNPKIKIDTMVYGHRFDARCAIHQFDFQVA